MAAELGSVRLDGFGGLVQFGQGGDLGFDVGGVDRVRHRPDRPGAEGADHAADGHPGEDGGQPGQLEDAAGDKGLSSQLSNVIQIDTVV